MMGSSVLAKVPLAKIDVPAQALLRRERNCIEDDIVTT